MVPRPIERGPTSSVARKLGKDVVQRQRYLRRFISRGRLTRPAVLSLVLVVWAVPLSFDRPFRTFTIHDSRNRNNGPGEVPQGEERQRSLRDYEVTFASHLPATLSTYGSVTFQFSRALLSFGCDDVHPLQSSLFLSDRPPLFSSENFPLLYFNRSHTRYHHRSPQQSSWLLNFVSSCDPPSSMDFPRLDGATQKHFFFIIAGLQIRSTRFAINYATMRIFAAMVFQLVVLSTLAPLVLCAESAVQPQVQPAVQAPDQSAFQPVEPSNQPRKKMLYMPTIYEDGQSQIIRYSPFNPRNTGPPKILASPRAEIPANQHPWWPRVKLPAFMRPKVVPDSMRSVQSTSLQNGQPEGSNEKSRSPRFKLPWSSNSRSASTPATQETLSLSRLPSIKGEAPEFARVPVGPYWYAVRLPGNGWDNAVIQEMKTGREPFYAVEPTEEVGARSRVWLYSPNKQPRLLSDRRAQSILREMDINKHIFEPATPAEFRPPPEAATAQTASQMAPGRGRLWSSIADGTRRAVGKFKSGLASGIGRLRPL